MSPINLPVLAFKSKPLYLCFKVTNSSSQVIIRIELRMPGAETFADGTLTGPQQTVCTATFLKHSSH